MSFWDKLTSNTTLSNLKAKATPVSTSPAKKANTVINDFWSKVKAGTPKIPDNSTVGKIKNTYTAMPQAYKEVGKDVIQGTLRNTVGIVGVTAGNIPTQIANKLTPERNFEEPFLPATYVDNKAGKIFFGDKPVKTVQKAVADTDKFLSPYIGEQASGLASAPLVLASIGLDASGLGGARAKSVVGAIPEKVLARWAKELSSAKIARDLKSAKVPQNIADELAGPLSKAKTVDEVKKVLIDYSPGKAPVPKDFWNSLKEQEGKTLMGDLEGRTLIVEKGAFKDIPLYDRQGNKLTDDVSTFKRDQSYFPTEYKVGDKTFGTKKEAVEYSNELENTNMRNRFNPEKRVDATIRGVERQAIPAQTTKEPALVDRLIAENKIRVVSRDGRDVYQIRQGVGWKSVRDEDSAVRQVTREKPKYVPKPKADLPEELQLRGVALELDRDYLRDHKAKALRKRVAKTGEFKGVLPEATGRKNNKASKNTYAARGDAYALEAGYDGAYGSDDAREDMEKYLDLENTYQEDIKKFRRDVKAFKEEVKIREIQAKEAKRQAKTPLPSSETKPSVIDTTEGEGRSIEIQAHQALKALDSGASGENVSLPKIIQNTVTSVQHKVHFFDTFLTTPRLVMEKIGFGTEAKMLRNAMDEYWKELPKHLGDDGTVTNWIKRVPSKEANKRIFRYLDGEAISLVPEEKAVATEIKAYLKVWADRLGLAKDERISHYITHLFDAELIKKEFDEDLAKIIADKIPGSVYDPFLEKRLGAKGYIQDTWKALDAYVKRGIRKVHVDPVLEKIQAKTGSSLEVAQVEKSQFRYIQKYINNINMRPSEFEESFDNLIKSVIGYKLGQRPLTNVLRTLRRMTFRGMLGINPASALRNLSQGINTFATIGEKRTLIGYSKLFNKGAGAELTREGVLNAGFVQDRALNAAKKTIERADKVLFAFFDTAEKINRGAAYFGAKSKALAMGKTEQEAIDYAKSIVRKTQFVFDTVDTPVGMAGDIAKTLTQFQTFTVKQIEFLVQMAKNKNYAGMIRYAVYGLAFVYTIGRVFGMKPKELLPWFRFDVPPSLKAPVAIIKAIPGVSTTDKYGNKRDFRKKLRDVGNATIGLIPGGSQMKKTFEGIMAVREGGSFDKGGKLQFEQDQSIGGKYQSVLFGKYASKEAKDYFNKEELIKKADKQIKPVYDKAQALNKEGKVEEAQAIVDGLTDSEYETYKGYATKMKTKATLQGKKDILPVYLEIQKINETSPEEAQVKLDSLTDDEYKYYQLVAKQVKKDKKASEGKQPEFEDGEAQTPQGLINTVFTYAKAVGTDPKTAFNRIFTGQRIRYVTGGAIVVERLSLKDSEKIKKDRGGDTIELKLDHNIPLQLGGSNSEDNLILVPTEVHASFTPVENYLGKALRDKKVRRKEAQELIIRFKKGEITAEDVYSQVK